MEMKTSNPSSPSIPVFQIGDRVEIITLEDRGYFEGKHGTVADSLPNNGGVYYVRCDGFTDGDNAGAAVWVHHSDLRAVIKGVVL